MNRYILNSWEIRVNQKLIDFNPKNNLAKFQDGSIIDFMIGKVIHKSERLSLWANKGNIILNIQGD